MFNRNRQIDAITKRFRSVFDKVESDIERIHEMRSEGRYDDAAILRASCEERNELCKEILDGVEANG